MLVINKKQSIRNQKGSEVLFCVFVFVKVKILNKIMLCIKMDFYILLDKVCFGKYFNIQYYILLFISLWVIQKV